MSEEMKPIRDLNWVDDCPGNIGNWKERHMMAVNYPRGDHERAIVAMLKAWTLYATAHAEQFGGNIGDDQVLGPIWARMGKDIHGLLDGETGRLDCGTLSSIIYMNLEAQGFDWEEVG